MTDFTGSGKGPAGVSSEPFPEYPRRVEAVLLEHITDRKQLFVFPSEVVAESWRLRVLEIGPVRALHSDRFLSWDRLKEENFSPYRDRRPANLLFRLLFSSALLEVEDHADFPFRELVNPAYPEQAGRFSRWIAGLLPRLKRALSLIESGPSSVPPDLIEDLRYLYAQYRRFLDTRGLFEPSWQEPDPRGRKGTAHLFFPELLEDFEVYRPLLGEEAGFRVHLMREERGEEPLQGSREGPAGILRFSSARDELDYLLDSVAALLEEGTAPEEILISLPAYDSWKPFLEEGAALRGIPLQFRSGSPLTDFPVGRLFRALQELEAGGFTHSAIKDLFLNPVYPWRRRKMWRDIVFFAIKHSCLKSYREKERLVDPLARKLRRNGEPRTAAFYESFLADLKSLLHSGSLEDLNGRMVGFLTAYFDDELWGPEQRRVLQYALLQLRDLAEAEEGISAASTGKGSGGKGSAPYPLWLSVLDQRVYVPASSGPGVPVYRYRVTAGAYPRRHFIPGAGQMETRFVADSLAFLREDRRESIAEASLDLSGPYIEAYLRSGGRVQMSCSDRSFAGPQLPPAEFLSPRSDRFGPVVFAEGLKERKPSFPKLYPLEREAWADAAAPPARLVPLQRRGFFSMEATGLSEKGSDYSAMPIESAPLKEAVLLPLLSSRRLKVQLEEEAAAAAAIGAAASGGENAGLEGPFWFSPHSLDAYRTCPFAFYLSHALGIEERDYEIQIEDYRHIGVLVHTVFEELFTRIREEDGGFDPQKCAQYRRYARRAVEEVFTDYERKGRDLFPPEWRRLKNYLERRIDLFLEVERRNFPRFLVEETEESPRRRINERIGFFGRIDRISSINDRPAVIDYKSGEAPKKSAFYSQEVPELTQMPIYLLLAEKPGRGEAAAVSYYSLKDGAYTHLIYDGPGEEKGKMDTDEMRALAERVCREAERVRETMERGIFTVARRCEPCDFRPICRVKYSIRARENKARDNKVRE